MRPCLSSHPRCSCGSPCVLVVMLLVLGLGCGSSAAKLVPTDGVITLDGTPIAGVMITLHPEAGEGPSATALSGEDGVFQLQTHAAADGVLPGSYKVTARKTDAVAPPPAGNDPAKQ